MIMFFNMSWRSSWFEWKNKFQRFFYPLFLLCICLIRKKIIICWFWCLIQGLKNVFGYYVFGSWKYWCCGCSWVWWKIITNLTKRTKHLLFMLDNVEEAFDFCSWVDFEGSFHITIITINTHMNIVWRELVGFQCFPIDVESCKCVLSWW
jgi:hypothetical protein